MEHSAHKPHGGRDARRVRAWVVTVSDTRTLEDDVGGGLVDDELRAAGHEVVSRGIVRDDAAPIRAAIEAAIAAGAEAIILTGGTGIAPRDVTYEAVVGLLDKRLDGFGEAFRRLSWEQIGPRSILSRAVAGSSGRTFVVALPGSPAGVELAMTRIVLPVIGHAVGLLQGGASSKHGGADR